MRPLSKEHMSNPSRFIIIASIVLFFLFMVAPILFYQTHFAVIPEQTTEAAATTVAIGAVFRSNSRNFLKSTFMSAIRTALRTWIRRLVRLALPILLRVFLPLLKTKRAADNNSNPQPTSIALCLGSIVLWISF